MALSVTSIYVKYCLYHYYKIVNNDSVHKVFHHLFNVAFARQCLHPVCCYGVCCNVAHHFLLLSLICYISL